jgi:crossover junction endodeoxyribonuclease RuvC
MTQHRPARSRHTPDHIIFGVDPGVAIVGYAVISQIRGELTCLACSVVRTSALLPLEDRLLLIYRQIADLLREWQPTEAAMETLYFWRNTTTALSVAHARGVLLLAMREYGLSVAEYSPSQVKLAVTGYGKATKGQVGHMVQALLSLQRIPRPDDAADAAAVAICHAHTAVLRALVPPKP